MKLHIIYNNIINLLKRKSAQRKSRRLDNLDPRG